MKAVIQRVNFASVEVDKKIVGKIEKGLLVYLGISNQCNNEKINWIIKKILNLRLWRSENKGFDLSVEDISGEILIVSQFTLHAIIDGNKPNFKNSAQYDEAKLIYDDFIDKLKTKTKLKIQTGEFGAMMKIKSENDGPVTIILEK